MHFDFIKMPSYSTYIPVLIKIHSAQALQSAGKHPISFDLAVKGIIRKLIATGESEVDSRLVGH